jgi:hypothetical protein
MATWKSMVAPCRSVEGRKGAEAGGRRTRWNGMRWLSHLIGSSCLQDACMPVSDLSGIIGLPRTDHMICSRATERVVDHLTCDASCPLSKGRVREEHLLDIDESDLTAELMHSIMIPID